MKVKLTSKYLFKFIPPRCRKERAEVRTTEFTASIREIPAEDAPVAFIVREYGEYPSVVRLHNGKLYRNNFDFRTRYIYEDEHQCVISQTKHDLIPLDKTDWNWLLAKTWGYNDMTEDEVKAYSRKQAKDFIIVDGQLYRRTGEPFYKGMTFGLGRNHGGCGFFATYLPTARIKATQMFPLSYPATQRTEAIKATLMVAVRRGDTESYDHLLRGGNGNIQVLIPDACRYDFKPVHKYQYNEKYPPTEDDYKAVDAIGEPLPYDGSESDVLNEDDLRKVNEYISSIV